MSLEDNELSDESETMEPSEQEDAGEMGSWFLH